MNRDFRDLLSEFASHGVEFLVIGAHALAAHGHVRATKDLDVWVRASPENAARVVEALRAFGAPLTGVSVRDFARNRPRNGVLFVSGERAISPRCATRHRQSG